MESKISMETKKDIYSSWVQYTTKNEEGYFRHFVRGFVSIWEAQLQLDWNNLESLPNWTNVKPDTGPHLTRLPEELLPAIGKFIYIANDNTEKGVLKSDGLGEVDLLVRCLISISRNLDNIPLIASCDYIGLCISIASSIIQKIVCGNCEFETEGRTYCLSLCHLLECLYDPYFTWRHFSPTTKVPLETLTFQPALLHVEVIPFIYDCFQTDLAKKYPELSIELLNVLGAIVSGAESSLQFLSSEDDGESQSHKEPHKAEGHNALRSVCPATASLIMSVISDSSIIVDVRVVALRAFSAMVRVLQSTPPPQRQIEISTVIELYKESFDKILKESLKTEKIGGDELKLIIHVVRTVRCLLTMSSLSVQSLQLTLINSNILDSILSTLSSSSCLTSEEEKSNFLTECVKALASLISGTSSGKERILKVNGYEKLFSALQLYGKPDRLVLEALIAMTTESEDPNLLTLSNPETLIQLIGWVSHLDEENQIWMTNRLLKICTFNSNSLNLSCETGVITAVCNVLASQTVANLNSKALAELVQLLEALASHSLTAFELKQLFLLLREDNDMKNLYGTALLNALSAVSRKGAQQIQCHDYFEIHSENEGITITDMKKWSGASYGFSFYCWLRLDKKEVSENGQSSSHRRQLFNFVTTSGTGIEAFFCSDGVLIVGVNTKKELLAATVPECSMLDGLWHSLVICHTSARRPFGHNQLSVFIDGVQRLAASIKFPAFTEPFSVCTIGAVPARCCTSSASPTEKGGTSSTLVEKGILPSFITQVPNYFSLPLRTSAPMDPHVKNFPPGMQDTLFGPPTCLKGSVGLVSLFHEPLSLHQVKTLFEGGPNSRDLLMVEESAEHMGLSSKLVWCFSPAASSARGHCLDLAAASKFSATALATHCHTKPFKDVINGVGGIHVVYPILENIGGADELDLSAFSPSPLSTPSHSQNIDGWEVLPTSSTTDTRLQQNPVSCFLLLLRNILLGNTLNQEQLLKHNGVAILGDLLSKVPPAVMDIPVLVAVQSLIDLAKSVAVHKAASHTPTQPLMLRSFYQHILFNFTIWSKCPFHVKVGHIQYISTVIKDERKIFRKRYGIQFFLDTIRRNFSSAPENEESKAIRISLLGLIKYFLQKECNHKEISAIIGFLVTVKEEILVCEVLDMLITLLESKSCRDQLFIFMFEPHTADILYCLLIEKHFTMELKQRVLKLISVLLRTEKIYDRNKTRLRLSDHSPIGLYPGLIAMLPENNFSMEFTVILLEQILLTESSSSYASALSLIHALALCSVDVKLEAARKILTVTFMRPTAPQLFAKQLGWQDCITRLLVKCPISVGKSDSLPDLMSFEEDSSDVIGPCSIGGRCSPSSVSRLSMSDAASTLELEIKEVAETVSHAVADNIHYAADNITSAVASVYTSFKQKTVEMQESLEEFGETARCRLKKRRSLTSLEEPQSPLPVRTSQLLASLGLDMDTISFTNSDRRSQSSSDEGDGEDAPASPQLSLESSNSITSQSSLSLNSQTVAVDEATEDEILFDALQQLKALDAEKVFDREQELCYLVVNILFTIMWRGIDASQKDAWKERGEVMACINLVGLNNRLHCSHVELKLRIVEMAVTAALSDMRDSPNTSHNAAQLLRWVYDLTVLHNPNNHHSNNVSARLLDGVLGLLDSLLVFQEVPGEEWTEMAKLAFGIILSCAANSNLELCAMSTAKLHTLVQTRTMKDLQEGGYLLYFINTILQKAIADENQEHYSFLIPVVKALLEKLKDELAMSQHLPDLPQPQAGPAFFEGFQSYSQGQQWTTFMESKVKPLYEAYQSALSAELTESMNTFWAECYEASKTSTHRRNREVGESKLRFQSQIMSGYRSRQTEETVRYNNVASQVRNRQLIVRRCWLQMRHFFVGERGSWRQRMMPS
ncbi:neurobeachin-like protein 1 isoform X2 [Nilaparvata lugens]|uniref:neurobeachin-like protein 1 isoform X2 n=2 Tax=Nilaparvata lugens TaxID=108931 RepID=UPI00193E02A3|nr:neurobeachin-like protein 1 isoform X2 [Nilaparvata lugens]